MAKQVRLEEEAIESRESIPAKVDYYKGNEYSLEHPDAKSDGDKDGKGTGNAANPYLSLGVSKSKNTYTPTINTATGGSKKDMDVRNNLQVINLYNKNNQYCLEAIDTTKNEGQIRIS